MPIKIRAKQCRGPSSLFGGENLTSESGYQGIGQPGLPQNGQASLFNNTQFGTSTFKTPQEQTTAQFGGFGSSSQSTAPLPKSVRFATPLEAAQLVFGAPAPQKSAFGSPSTPTPPPQNSESNVAEESGFEEIAIPGPFSEPTTVVSETPLAISYAVEGKSTVPTDGIAHQVSVAVLPFAAKVSHVVIPRVDPRVYLQVRLVNRGCDMRND